ncbi:NAD(P)-binding protein [Sarocladium strictum]
MPLSPTQVIFESGDASKRADLDAAVAKLVKKAGGAKIDVLVAFASVSDQDGPIIGYSEEDLRRNFEINILGSFNTIQSVSPFLANNAQLFNISSGMLHIKPYGRHWLSASSKGLIAKMFDFLADEKPEMHVVSVQPGVVATDYNKRFGVTGMDHPDLNAHFCVWLASPEAAFLKGKFVWANWDKDELVAKADEIKNSPLFRILLHGVEM